MDSKEFESPSTSAAHQTAQLLELLERSQRLLNDGENLAQPQRRRRTLIELRLARNEAVTQVLRLSALIAALAATQEKITAATRKLADGLKPLESS